MSQTSEGFRGRIGVVMAGTEPEPLALADDEVVVVVTDGAIDLVPRTVRRLPADVRSVITEIRDLEIQAQEIRSRIDECAVVARMEGVPWSAIAWALGMTESGVKDRYHYDMAERQERVRAATEKYREGLGIDDVPDVSLEDHMRT